MSADLFGFGHCGTQEVRVEPHHLNIGCESVGGVKNIFQRMIPQKQFQYRRCSHAPSKLVPETMISVISDRSEW